MVRTCHPLCRRQCRSQIFPFVVREKDARWFEFWDASSLGHHATATFGFVGFWADGIGLVVELEAHRVALKGTFAQPLQAACAVPWALIVGVENVAFGIHANSAWAANAAARWNDRAIGFDPHAPPTIIAVRGE